MEFQWDLMEFQWDLMDFWCEFIVIGFFLRYPLVNIQKTMENHHV